MHSNLLHDARPGFAVAEVSHSFWLIREQYKDLKVIGHGAFGVVCCAYDEKLQRKVAVKRLMKSFDDQEYAKRTYREISILNHVDHENVICLIDVFSPQMSLKCFRDIYLVTPLMDTDLELVIRNQKLSDDQVKFIAYQILRALKYMHSAGLIHRDLKPVNIGVNLDCECKILDFGLARQTGDEMTGYVTTRWYRAPEIIVNWMHYNESVDIWSVACIMVELWTRKPFFNGSSHIDQVKIILQILGMPDEECMQKIKSQSAQDFLNSLPKDGPKDLHQVLGDLPSDAVDLLQKLLHLDPDRRFTAPMALAHSYFETYHDESDEPTGELFISPLEDRSNITVDEWRSEVWNLLENFVPNTSSLSVA